MNPLRCVVVDDEPLARSLLGSLLTVHPDLELVGEAESVATAVQRLDDLRPDVVFLDIRMPDGTGFDVLARLGSRPRGVVFVTAYDEFAVQAFRENALDYLLKPLEPERVADSVARLRERLRESPPPAVSLMDEPIEVRDGRKTLSVPLREVLWITSEANYTRMEVFDGPGFVFRQTLSSWSERLPTPPFLKLDRFLIVNLEQVIRAEFGSTGGLVFFGGGRELALGRQASLRLRLFLEGRAATGGG